jgi:hypothetical protein
MPWFDIADGRLRFRGRVTKQPIVEWIATREGAEAIEAAARQTGFSLIGRSRSARRRLCRELSDAVAAAPMRETIADECDRYLRAWTQLAYAPSLPRLAVASQRLVVVPRTMILARAIPGVCARVEARLEKTGIAEPFKAFFSRWLFHSMDDAIRRGDPSPHRPIMAHDSWACVALDSDFIWIDPLLSGPAWRGHVMMFEMAAKRLQRRDRRQLEAAVEQLKQSLPQLARLQRDGIVRLATDQMTSLRFGPR